MDIINCYQFSFIFLILLLISFFLLIILKNKKIKLVFTLFSSIIFSLLILEIVLGLLYKTSHNTEILDTKIFNLSNKNIVTENHKISVRDKTLFDVKYSKYENGFRYTECNVNSKETYVFMGCSFIYGWGVNDNETLPYYFSQITKFENNIINCAHNGKSSNTALNILKSDILDKFKDKDSKIKIFFYEIMCHSAKRNFQYIGNLDWLYADEKFIEPIQPYNFMFKYFSKSYIFTEIFLDFFCKCNKKFYDDYLVKSIYEINKIVNEKYNSKLIVIMYDDVLDNKELKNLNVINIEKIEVIDKKNDGHPTAKTNKEIANTIFEYIKNNKLK